MASKVMIKKIRGEEVGEVTQAADGQLLVKAYHPEIELELQQLVETVSRQPLRYVYGTTENVEGKIVHKTLGRTVNKGDPYYLEALADALSEPTVRLRGDRLQGQVIA